MPDISVIIPTFNRKELLSETLENIFKQSLPPSEIIVVDDHSTDGTIEFLKEKYGNKLITLTNKGKGPGAARNTGFEISTGDYIKFFDSDDLMTSNTLEVQSKVLDATDKKFIYGPYFYSFNTKNGHWAAKDNTVLSYSPFPKKKTLTQWMTRGLFIAIPGMLFKRSLLEKVGLWRTDITNYEDWDYLWRLSKMEPKPTHINSCAFLYRQHSNQSTIENYTNDERDKEALKVFSKIAGDLTNDLSVLDKLFLYNLWKRNVNEKFNFRSDLAGIVQRIYQKYSRTRSGSDWMHFYGSKKSEALISKYLQLID